MANKEIQYWVFQANPTIYNIREALRQEVIETFAVKAHKSKIKKGDKFILWVTGKESGCYALGEVLTGVANREEGKKERRFWIEEAVKITNRVKVRIDYNLWNRPVFKDQLVHPVFSSFKINYPGTNFSATKEQHDNLLDLVLLGNAVREPLTQYEINRPTTNNFPLNLLLYGPPGTGKTYQTINYAVAVIENKRLEEIEIEALNHRNKVKQRYDDYVGSGHIGFITFHQSMSYEDFVEGIKPKTDENKAVYYEIEPGIFKKMVLRANAKSENCVLIVDEINRGNIAGIFGELITLIEADKRAGNPEMLTVQLPYSKEVFSIPSNLYLIGTMNTADRSVETLDMALRRRFTFVEVAPNPNLITKAIGKIVLSQLLSTINERIATLLDKEHCIGHAYFMNLTSLDDLKTLFQKQLIPLLQEYFFNDWGKLGLVLGRKFVRRKRLSYEEVFADFPYESVSDYGKDVVYEITDAENWDELAFVSVYEES